MILLSLITGCSSARAKMSDYHDGRLTGREMQRIARHLDGCTKCTAEFQSERHMLRALASLGCATGTVRQQPDDLLLRIRVAISQERAERHRDRWAEWKITWRNSVGPFLLQLSAGVASAVLLLGTVGVLVGMVAHPERAIAQDEPLGMATGAHFLYNSGTTSEAEQIGTAEGPVVVEAYVNTSGMVYDYRIVSGPNDAHTQSQVENLLLFSVFEPARSYGQPVRGLAVLSFSGVSVRG